MKNIQIKWTSEISVKKKEKKSIKERAILRLKKNFSSNLKWGKKSVREQTLWWKSASQKNQVKQRQWKSPGGKMKNSWKILNKASKFWHPWTTKTYSLQSISMSMRKGWSATWWANTASSKTYTAIWQTKRRKMKEKSQQSFRRSYWQWNICKNKVSVIETSNPRTSSTTHSPRNSS